MSDRLTGRRFEFEGGQHELGLVGLLATLRILQSEFDDAQADVPYGTRREIAVVVQREMRFHRGLEFLRSALTEAFKEG